MSNHHAYQMSNHHAYQMYAHITWHTWKRVGCVDAAAASDVESAVTSACQASGVRVLRSAILTDHVHVVVSFRPDNPAERFRASREISVRNPCQSAGPRCRPLGARLL